MRRQAITTSDFNRREPLILAGKLRLLAEDVGFTDSEVETLICVRTGGWPLSPAMCDLWCPSELQERRLRMLVEVCVSSITLIGPDVRLWLRERQQALGTSPARFLLGSPDALPALRDALRAEVERL